MSASQQLPLILDIANSYIRILHKLVAKSKDLYAKNYYGNALNQTFYKAWFSLMQNPQNMLNGILEYQISLLKQSLSLNNPLDFLKSWSKNFQAYFDQLIRNSNLAPQDEGLLKFISKQVAHALDPENFLHCNLDALQECINSNLQSVLKGLQHLEEDLDQNKSIFAIPNTDKSAFKLGENIAATSGKVVFKNDLIELICYQPKDKTYSIPILIVPPCINKYYILDLSESNSFVKWLVDNNFQVFMISWANPMTGSQNFSFEHYIFDGILAATKQILEFGYDKVHPIGYCIGGTMLATALAYCANRGKDLFQDATFLNTLLDFSDVGELSIFLRSEVIDGIRSLGQKSGYLDGAYLNQLFNLLKPRELIWSSYVRKYLHGKSPRAMDLLYWNSDYTNLPLQMMEFYLEKICIQNLLRTPGGIKIAGEPIDLSKVSLSSFFVASKADHIVPWNTSYEGAAYLGGKKTFCLTESGHVAGIVNPAHKNKYSCWIGKPKADTKTWIESAVEYNQSWWNNHLNWLKKRGGKLKNPIDYFNLEYYYPAPGKFCLQGDI